MKTDELAQGFGLLAAHGAKASGLLAGVGVAVGATLYGPAREAIRLAAAADEEAVRQAVLEHNRQTGDRMRQMTDRSTGPRIYGTARDSKLAQQMIRAAADKLAADAKRMRPTVPYHTYVEYGPAAQHYEDVTPFGAREPRYRAAGPRYPGGGAAEHGWPQGAPESSARADTTETDIRAEGGTIIDTTGRVVR